MQGDAEDDSKASSMDGSYWKNQNRLVVNLGANRKHMVIRKVKSVCLACIRKNTAGLFFLGKSSEIPN
jgi:hypothetical protein